MDNILKAIKKICGANGCTTYSDIAEEMNVSYGTIYYWVNKYYKQGLVGIIYPGLGMGRLSERYIYPKNKELKTV